MGYTRSRLLERVTAPAAEPLTLAEAKLYLRVDTDDDDSAIGDMIVAARLAAEQSLKKSLITQSWKLAFDDYLPEKVALPMGPVDAITSVKTIDRDENEQIISADVYYLNAAKDMLMLDSILFSFRVEIVYQTGYGAAADVPEAIRHGMLAHIAAMYDLRGQDTLTAIPAQALQLYAPYREVRL